MQISHRQQGGYSIVEVLVAITILMLAIAGPLTIAAKSIQSARFAKDQTTAFFLAQEGIENVIKIRNQAIIEAFESGDLSTVWNWVGSESFGGTSLTACFASDGCEITSYNNSDFGVLDCSTAGNCLLDLRANNNTGRFKYIVDTGNSDTDSIFTRVITIEETVTGQELQVTATVTWASNILQGQTETVTLSTFVYNLYES